MTATSPAQSLWLWAPASSLAQLLWQGALLAALLALVLRFTPSRHSRLRYGLALAALAGFPLLLALNLALIMIPRLGALTGLPARAGGPLRAVGERLEPFLNLDVRLDLLWAGLAVTYVLGAGLLAGRVVTQLLYVRQLQRSAVPVDGTLQVRLQSLARRLGAVVPRLALSSRVDTAMVMGWRRPLILLPAGAETRLTPRQLDGVLLHELAHISTRDYAVNLFQLLTEALLFYHPALWWVSGVARQEREYRCDDLAARACGDRRDYAEALLALEKARSRPVVPVALAGTSGDFEARIRRLFGQPVPHTGLFNLAVRLAAALALGVGVGFAQPPSSAPSASALNPRGAPQPEALTPGRGLDEGPGRNNLEVARPFGEPTPAECAALRGRWYHIQIAGLGAEPPDDPGIAAPPKTPATEFSVKTPGVDYRGRCAVERRGEE